MRSVGKGEELQTLVGRINKFEVFPPIWQLFGRDEPEGGRNFLSGEREMIHFSASKGPSVLSDAQ